VKEKKKKHGTCGSKGIYKGYRHRKFGWPTRAQRKLSVAALRQAEYGKKGERERDDKIRLEQGLL